MAPHELLAKLAQLEMKEFRRGATVGGWWLRLVVTGFHPLKIINLSQSCALFVLK